MVSKLEALGELLRLGSSPAQVTAAQVTAERFLETLQAGGGAQFVPGSWLSAGMRSAIRGYVCRPDVEAGEALVFLQLAGDLRGGDHPTVQAAGLEHLQAWWQSHDHAVDLLGFARLWKGRREDWFLAFQDRSWNQSWPRLDDAFLLPYLEDRLGYLLGSIEVAGYPPPERRSCDWSAGASRALKLLARFSAPPKQCVERLWQLALGEARLERELAQECLRKHPEWQAQLVKSLRPSQAGPRQRAAEWAGRARLQEALPGLTSALQREKVEKCRLAQMEALKLLGAPLETYLHREGLLSEAKSLLAKGTPPWLASLPFPEQYWSEGGQPLEPLVLQGLVLGAVRLKSPEPSAWLKTICQHLQVGPRQAWGKALLDWWIAADLAGRLSEAEVRARLPAMVDSLRQVYKLLGQPRTPASLEAEAQRQLTHEVQGSAIELKGVLALAGACGGAQLIDTVGRYLTEWYGLRAAQCKALVAMLAHAEEKEAVHYLLGVARRFRTKGIQEEAQRRLRERAERLGWSLEDMADLSLPDGGLDDEGRLTLEVGEQVVSLQLLADGNWSPKSLPAVGDPEQVKEANRRWKASQKTIKEVFKSLGQRLYDAMCSGRTWSYSSWETCLLRHPLARRSCQALVWQSGQQTFRPSEDGSLIDADHATLKADADWTLSLAHPLTMSPELVGAWSAHLADYELLQPFPQLARPVWPKPPEPREELQGHMLTSFQLRNRAKTLGYDRGASEDGGVFFEYRKTLGTSGWVIRVLFSGSELPETLHPVALQGLAFDFQQRQAEWGEVPDILWSEAYNDLRDLAQQGSGFDPDWQKKASVR